MQVVVDSLLTQYELSGKGKLILFLHGWGDAAAGSRQLQQRLSQHYMVIAPDLPGFGGTEAPRTPWGLSDYAQFAQHFLQKIDAKQPYAIIGHSNGGAIAIRGLAQGLLKTDKLILLASSGIRGTYKGRVKVLRIAAKIGKVFTKPLPGKVKQRLRKGVYQTVGSDMLVAEHLQETFKKIVTDDVRQDAATLTQPTLLIYGEDDTQAPTWYGETYHQLIKVSTLEILPGAGHFVHLDRPEEVQNAIESFIK